MENIINEIISSKLIWFLIGIIVTLIGVIIFLLCLFFRRGKTYDLKNLTLNTKQGIGINIELNEDKRLRLINIKNHSLRKRVKNLKSTTIKQGWQLFTLSMVILIIYLLDKMKPKEGIVQKDVLLLDN